MSDESAKPGPWNQNQTTKVTISPITFEITTSGESSHVPVREVATEGTVAGISMEQLTPLIQQGLTMIMSKLDEVLAAQKALSES